MRELVGSDLLTIAPKVLTELESTEGELARKLDPVAAKSMPIDKIVVDSLHASVAIEAMEKGKHVLCEKLMGWNIDAVQAHDPQG